jgi:hypothetical protein
MATIKGCWQWKEYPSTVSDKIIEQEVNFRFPFTGFIAKGNSILIGNNAETSVFEINLYMLSLVENDIIDEYTCIYDKESSFISFITLHLSLNSYISSKSIVA